MKFGILKSTTLAGLFGLGLLAAAPASAHQVYVNCDRDGDRCVRTICDDDGDRCTRVVYRDRDRSYYGRGYYSNGYYDNGYYGSGYNGYRYGYRNHRRWGCDSDGDRCNWRNDRW